jgi:hypothetical protein
MKKQPASTSKTIWSKEYLPARGIPNEFAKDSGVVVRDSRTGEGQITFQKFHPLTDEELNGSRTRLEKPWIDKNGKEQHWKQAHDSGNFPYFAPTLPWKEIFGDIDTPVTISEGETRSLAGAQYGIPIMGCGGCNGVFEAGSQRQKLHPIFKEMVMHRGKKHRHLVLAFDADADSNDNVRSAESAAIKLFIDAGALVHEPMRMPRVTGKGKDGIDDVIHALGIDAFKAMFAASMASPALELDTDQGDRPDSVCIDDVVEQPVDWIWEDRIARAEITILTGDPGAGKSFMAVKIAAELSKGLDPFTGKKFGKPLRTIYATNEASTEHTTKPRYRLANGAKNSLHILNGALGKGGNAKDIVFADLRPLEQLIKKTKADLVVFDPLQAYFGPDADSYKANEVRPLMSNVLKLAKKYSIGIVIIRHMAKAGGGRAIGRGLGSIDFSATVRIEFMIGTRAGEDDEKHMLPVKNNIGPMAEGLCYHIEKVKETIQGKNVTNARLIWNGKSTASRAELMAPETSNKKPGTKVARCEEFMRGLLTNGRMKVDDLVNKSGYDLQTVQRAGRKLNVIHGGLKKEASTTMELPPPARFTAAGTQGRGEKGM